jgi:dCTP deaminase
MVLADAEIVGEIKVGRLVKHGSEAQIGPACYELRMGNVYYDLTEGNRRIEVEGQQKILIKPGHRVVLIVHEELVIPDDILARVVNKGSLFSIGLSPVCTYADPGFQGNIGLVTQNISDKYIELPIGEAVAKVDFSRLSQSVTHPYHGQHGFRTAIWPIKSQLQKTYSEVKADPRVESEEAEAYKLLPNATTNLLRRMERRQRTVDIALLVAIVVNALILALISTKVLDTVFAICTNLIASAVVGLFTVFLPRRR